MMTKPGLITTIVELFLLDGLFSFGLVWWAEHDQRIASPILYFLALPLITVLAVFMAALQVYYYRHPDKEEKNEVIE
jgi:glucan phosphoethanolaminetransferase (alkaline phosphatase superfamily)